MTPDDAALAALEVRVLRAVRADPSSVLAGSVRIRLDPTPIVTWTEVQPDRVHVLHSCTTSRERLWRALDERSSTT